LYQHKYPSSTEITAPSSVQMAQLDLFFEYDGYCGRYAQVCRFDRFTGRCLICGLHQ
jgi:hypothetical protein